MGEGNYADAWAAFRDPAVVHGMCEDYRAGLRADREHEEADRAAGRKIRCPMLLLVSTDDDLDIHGDPEAIWRPWTSGGLRRRPIHSRHHQANRHRMSSLQPFSTSSGIPPLVRPIDPGQTEASGAASRPRPRTERGQPVRVSPGFRGNGGERRNGHAEGTR